VHFQHYYHSNYYKKRTFRFQFPTSSDDSSVSDFFFLFWRMEDGTCHKKSCHLAILVDRASVNTGVGVITIYSSRSPVAGHRYPSRDGSLVHGEPHASPARQYQCRRPPSVHASYLVAPSPRSQPRLLSLAPTVEAARGKNLGTVRKILPPW
jgi:hypothetical protein